MAARLLRVFAGLEDAASGFERFRLLTGRRGRGEYVLRLATTTLRRVSQVWKMRFPALNCSGFRGISVGGGYVLFLVTTNLLPLFKQLTELVMHPTAWLTLALACPLVLCHVRYCTATSQYFCYYCCSVAPAPAPAATAALSQPVPAPSQKKQDHKNWATTSIQRLRTMLSPHLLKRQRLQGISTL